jgi:general L-amino acid transport system substrate-binding protein
MGRFRVPALLLLALALVATACNGEVEDPADVADLEDPEVDEEIAIEEEVDEEPEVAEAEPTNGTLAEVRSRGHLECGVKDSLPGFGFLTPEGEFEGFDVDYCRALAAAVLGDADAVEYTALTAEARLTAVQAREVDVLIRNTTWTATRDGSESISFATTTFYDAQGMMVRADAPFNELEDMTDAAVCVLSGTTTEVNLETEFSARGIPYEPLTFEDNDTLREAFLADRCDGWTSDKSQLAAFRSAWPDGGSDVWSGKPPWLPPIPMSFAPP